MLTTTPFHILFYPQHPGKKSAIEVFHSMARCTIRLLPAANQLGMPHLITQKNEARGRFILFTMIAICIINNTGVRR